MGEFNFEDWLPMPPQMGPPLPRHLGIFWPWYVPEAPPGGFACPYCTGTFATYDELVAHVQSEHPGERIPIPIDWL